jgi:hypothetical protein
MSRGVQTIHQRRASPARRRCHLLERRLKDAEARRRLVGAELSAGAGTGREPLLRAWLRDASLSVLAWRETLRSARAAVAATEGPAR